MKITIATAQAYRNAFLALNGWEKITENPGKEPLKSIVPYKLSGKARMKIGRTIRAIDELLETAQKAIVALRKQFDNDETLTPEQRTEAFNAELVKMDLELHEVKIENLSEEELNLEQNSLPVDLVSFFLYLNKHNVEGVAA